MFKGSCVAIVTPHKDGEADYNSLKKLVNWHIEAGTDCIVPCGSTGEAATLDYDEHKKVIRTVVKAVAGRCKIMAGAGSNSTKETLELTEFAKNAGADGALLITPYYNRPTQEGLFKHYEKVALKVDIPICLYNVPRRTGVNLEPATAVRLAELDNIIAIKEASGNIAQAGEILRLAKNKMLVLSGDDSLTYPLMAMGARGVISVVANLIPSQMHELCDLFLKGEREESLKLHFKYLPLMDAMFIETNPAPVKEALAMMGKICPELRLPLVNLSETSMEKLKKVLLDFNLVENDS
ncbi:MAG: 4-hydroxy-tetrahydrodipicolinate synthase [Elusimicrobia bacterium]|nr:4-hydroxy-tetrahydrodipicolinate synthase [Elusimicrobiota bacterium]